MTGDWAATAPRLDIAAGDVMEAEIPGIGALRNAVEGE